MTANLDRTIAKIAQTQHALITTTQAYDAGLSRKAVRVRLATGRWVTVHRGVHRLAGAPPTWEQRALAAALAVGHDALVSHRCGAHLWSIDGFRPPGMIDVTVPRGVRVQALRGVRVHESKAFDLAGACRRRGVPTTGAARTVLDVCATVGHDRMVALSALDGARRLGIAPWAELWETLGSHACRGRNGIVLFREVLLERWGVRLPGGHLERTVLAMIASAGLPTPHAEHEVVLGGRRFRIDLAYPDQLVAIELDGKQTHLQDDAFESDRTRQNELELAGWLVLRFTWRRVIEEPMAVVTEISRALVARGHLLAS